MADWEPVLDGDLADRARDAVRDIARSLPDNVEPALTPDLTLWWAYAAEIAEIAEIGAAHYDDATAALLRHIELGPHERHLHRGLAGAGWVLAHITDGGAEDALAAIDVALLDALAKPPDDGELVTGLGGIAVYFLERLAGASPALARRGLDEIVARLAATARRDGDGAAWSRDRTINCGAAHGVPGTVAVLGRIAAISEPPGAAAGLCTDAIRWLATQRRSSDPDAWFPASVVDGRRVGRPRNAWCYGDPGIAISVWSAASRIAAPTAAWCEVARAAAARPEDACGVEVPGLCHGAFGLAHLFNRGFQASGDAELRDAARRWFGVGLAMRQPGQGIAGFVTRRRESGELTWVGSPDFIEGATGIGLALLAGLGGDEPGWDRWIACDLPPRRR